MTNNISTFEDIRAARKAERIGKAEAITLPSGHRYKLYRPSAGEILMLTGMLPQSIAATISPAEKSYIPLSDQLALARQRVAVLELVIVEPAVALSPQAGELSLFDIPEADREFAWKWAYGEVAQDGSDLRSFRGEERDPASLVS